MLRITGGEFRGRVLWTPSNTQTRPTLARLRQALFNSIQAKVAGAKVLDLFAGPGTLGFEALSRGADQVLFVEVSQSVRNLIRKNAEALQVHERIRLIGERVERAWPLLQPDAPFDLVFADPPYAEGHERKIFNYFPWGQLLKPNGFFCLEWGIQQFRQGDLPERFPFLVKVRQKFYGDSVLTHFQGCEK